jgi:hypothetical protein
MSDLLQLSHFADFSVIPVMASMIIDTMSSWYPYHWVVGEGGPGPLRETCYKLPGLEPTASQFTG